jgi:hypothetical protein
MAESALKSHMKGGKTTLHRRQFYMVTFFSVTTSRAFCFYQPPRSRIASEIQLY